MTTPGPVGERRWWEVAKENRRMLFGLVVGALVAVFALLNIDDVAVDWIFGTWQTPLIIVIAASFLLGGISGWIAAVRRSNRQP